MNFWSLIISFSPPHMPDSEVNVIERQRHSVFVFSCIGLSVLSVAMFVIAVTSADTLLSGWFYFSLLATALITMIFYMRGRIPATTAISIICIANQFLISYSTLLRAVEGTPHGINIIIGNMTLAVSNILLAIAAYLRVVPWVLSGLILVSYGISVAVTGNSTVAMMVPIFFIPVITLSLISHRLTLNIRRLEQEKDALKQDEAKILNLFDLDKPQLMAYITLAREKGLSSDQTRQMLDTVGIMAEKNIRDNVSRWMVQSRIDYNNLASRLPGLGRSELEICRLILQGVGLSAMIDILGKSSSNITAQRHRIRKKLGLTHSENLREALQTRVSETKEAGWGGGKLNKMFKF